MRYIPDVSDKNAKIIKFTCHKLGGGVILFRMVHKKKKVILHQPHNMASQMCNKSKNIVYRR